MTKTHVELDETLKDVKKVRASFCTEPFKKSPRLTTDLVVQAQKTYKLDFIRNFKITQEKVNLFKTCYHLTGIGSRVEKIKP